MFAADRDLVVLEPDVFGRVAWAGQKVLDTTAEYSGLTLTFAGLDLRERGVDVGSVLLVDGIVLEVTKVSTSVSCVVSRVRGERDAGAIDPGLSEGAVVVRAWTFGPQIGLVHGWLLAMLGLTDADGPGEGELTNPEELIRVEALGALHLIFAASAAMTEQGSAARTVAADYRERFVRERGRVVAKLDLDGDGVADAARRLSLVSLGRV